MEEKHRPDRRQARSSYGQIPTRLSLIQCLGVTIGLSQILDSVLGYILKRWSLVKKTVLEKASEWFSRFLI